MCICGCLWVVVLQLCDYVFFLFFPPGLLLYIYCSIERTVASMYELRTYSTYNIFVGLEMAM
jgi:hypothetical protein